MNLLQQLFGFLLLTSTLLQGAKSIHGTAISPEIHNAKLLELPIADVEVCAKKLQIPQEHWADLLPVLQNFASATSHQELIKECFKAISREDSIGELSRKLLFNKWCLLKIFDQLPEYDMFAPTQGCSLPAGWHIITLYNSLLGLRATADSYNEYKYYNLAIDYLNKAVTSHSDVSDDETLFVYTYLADGLYYGMLGDARYIPHLEAIAQTKNFEQATKLAYQLYALKGAAPYTMTPAAIETKPSKSPYLGSNWDPERTQIFNALSRDHWVDIRLLDESGNVHVQHAFNHHPFFQFKEAPAVQIVADCPIRIVYAKNLTGTSEEISNSCEYGPTSENGVITLAWHAIKPGYIVVIDKLTDAEFYFA